MGRAGSGLRLSKATSFETCSTVHSRYNVAQMAELPLPPRACTQALIKEALQVETESTGGRENVGPLAFRPCLERWASCVFNQIKPRGFCFLRKLKLRFFVAGLADWPFGILAVKRPIRPLAMSQLAETQQLARFSMPTIMCSVQIIQGAFSVEGAAYTLPNPSQNVLGPNGGLGGVA